MKVNYQGKQVDANEVEVLQSDEKWNEYQLADGKVILVKAVLMTVQRLANETTPDGMPIYTLQTQILSRVK